MAALDTPWLAQMSNPKIRPDTLEALTTSPDTFSGAAPPTYASFSPASLSKTSKNPSRTTAKRSTILIHQKSPLLLATPPQVTRALAYSHPFLLPLNRLAGLLTWTSGDPWESFLLLAGFWAVVLYGDCVLRVAGPIVVVVGLIGGMYGRRFSPLSSSGWAWEPSSMGSALSNTTGKIDSKGSGKAAGGLDIHGGVNHKTVALETTNTRHQKTLDEIVETLKEFTARCDMLLEPMLRLTDFLSTQRTPTSATVRPALTTLFIRIFFCTPFWYALTLSPFCIITTRRIVMVFGTLILSWHSRPARVLRTLLWRSSTVRRVASLITGLDFHVPLRPSIGRNSPFQSTKTSGEKKAVESELTRQFKGQSLHHKLSAAGNKSHQDAGVKFTFIIYENQRRWVGMGWTSNMFAYERAAWTDEHNNQVPNKDEFELPDVEEESRMRWRWVKGSLWRVDGVPSDEMDFDGEAGKMGWVYYDNKWQNGRRGQDGWGRWTRRRKWYRDAELVDIDVDPEESLPSKLSVPEPIKSPATSVTSGFKPTMQGYTVSERMISPMRPEVSISTSRSPSIASFLHFQENGDRGNQSGSQNGDAAGEEVPLSESPRSFFKNAATLKRRSQQARAARSIGGRDGTNGREEVVEVLGGVTGLEIEGLNKDRQVWGIGDEAHMSLE